jgi:hypothetical protein
MRKKDKCGNKAAEKTPNDEGKPIKPPFGASQPFSGIMPLD